jgi:hypothetical protein
VRLLAGNFKNHIKKASYYNFLLIVYLKSIPHLCIIKFLTMNMKNLSKLMKATLLVLTICALLVPPPVYAGTDNGIGNGGLNNGNGNGNGGDNGDNGDDDGSGSVPVNGGLVFLTLAGLAYCAKKFYDLKRQQLAVA